MSSSNGEIDKFLTGKEPVVTSYGTSIAAEPDNDDDENDDELNIINESIASSLQLLPTTSSIPSEVVNMTKNIIGGGALSLSGGMAQFANSNAAAISAVEWIFVLGAVFGYFCLIIGKSCDLTHSNTYRECWEKSVGPTGGRLIAIINTLDPLVGIFANASVLSQSIQLLLQALDIYWSVQACLLIITLFAILPLCLLKSIHALTPFSALGMVSMLYTLVFMILRNLDGSYQVGGMYYDDISPKRQPSFGTRNRPWSTDALPFVTMAYTAFDMHFNSPRFYAELQNASIPRFRQTVMYSFGITSVIYSLIAVAGFVTFGEHCESFILNNYSPKDPLAIACRLAIGVCALVTYPLNFMGVRDNCLDTFGITISCWCDSSTTRLNAFTILLLSLMTFIECFFQDLGLIMSVGGGTTVALVCFVFPAFMYWQAIVQTPYTSDERREIWFVMILMGIGVIFGLIGVWNSCNRK